VSNCVRQMVTTKYPPNCALEHKGRSSLSQGKSAKTFILLSVLEHEVVAQLCVVSHTEQVVSACEKCFLMSKECSFAVLLQSTHHGKKKSP
jgi:hypothetical protein